ncbi:DNA-methyltransferase [Kosmotoga olearia]|uniref:DNA-methyltransferase n=1 Tax=Kosmotoga olearia TaxID=651457 RepID=UPI000A05C305|nr:site-specific DNA-methyltransferase [Kosmotoga olearia]
MKFHVLCRFEKRSFLDEALPELLPSFLLSRVSLPLSAPPCLYFISLLFSCPILQGSSIWLKEAWRVLKSNVSLYVSCTYHNIGEIIFLAKKIGFRLNNIITWYKTNAMPNITKRTFTHSTEYVCWFVKGNKWKFNYEELKKINPNKRKDGKPKQMRDFLNFIEMPIVQGKERIKGENGRAIHPTQKPEKLLEIIIIASSNEGDIVLDPFFGTGTTGVVAERLNRKWIGIEINEKFIKVAKNRVYGGIGHA